MDVSIIYVNYNTVDLIADSIRSVIQHTKGLDYEIIAVDNNTQSLESLKSIYQSIKLIQLNDNVGFGNANNAGAKEAKGNCLFFLNPDTLLINDAISLLYHEMEKDKRIGITGGNLYDVDGNPIHSYNRIDQSTIGYLRRMFIPSSFLSKLSNQHNFSNELKEVGYITGADLMIRRSIFEEIGGFCKEMFMYYEDVELNYRVHKLGYKSISVPSAKIKHLEGVSISSGDEDEKQWQRDRMNARSKTIFLSNRYHKWYALFLLNLFICNIRIKGLILKCIGKQSKGNRKALELNLYMKDLIDCNLK